MDDFSRMKKTMFRNPWTDFYGQFYHFCLNIKSKKNYFLHYHSDSDNISMLCSNKIPYIKEVSSWLNVIYAARARTLATTSAILIEDQTGSGIPISRRLNARLTAEQKECMSALLA